MIALNLCLFNRCGEKKPKEQYYRREMEIS